ncbi:MAG TPA: cellulose binding domain-containing protein [Polyangiaceae bacterium]|nr:cellulose binding domain-containing protein [Polyangiaceae bacterium]
MAHSRAALFSMTKTWQFRVFSLYLTLGIPLAASCAKEANTLEEGETQQGGSGNTGKAGSGNSQAGTLAKAGTTGNAFGGTTSTAGKGSAGTEAAEGGEASVAGTSSGGKGGATAGGSGGAGGTGTVPPDVLARADVIVYYETSHTTASDKIIQMKLYVENKSADPLPMAHVKIRYWFTAEATPTLHQYYTGAEAQMPKAVFVDAAADSHALMTFGGGSIVKGGDRNKSEIQLEISSATTAFTQTGDYSWQPTSTTSKPNDRITLYLDDELIWGCEPSGKCFGDTTGAGGQGAGGNDAGGQGAGGNDAGGNGAGGAP